MTDRRPSLADLLTAYGRALVAKLQMREFGNWGGGVMERFRQPVAEHEEMERETSIASPPSALLPTRR